MTSTATQTTPVDPQVIKTVTVSYGACCGDPKFFDTFYDIFLKKSPKIGEMFKNTDMPAQKAALRSGITFLVGMAKGRNVAVQKVQQLGESHSRNGLKVSPTMYPLWVDALLEAVQAHDDKYDEETDKAWRALLSVGIDALIAAR